VKRGPKPTPTATKELRGNPGKRPLNDAEPRPPQRRPPCPPHLDDAAKAEWRWITRYLLDIGVLTVIDKAALAAYCQAYSRWAKAEETLKTTGLVLKSAEGNFYTNPYLAVANKALAQMHSFLCEFGLTPASRTRVKATLDDPSLAILTLDEEAS
jgi:P27 family predicted phage terminase small subunit